MPPQTTVRLNPAARKKLKRLLRRFYQQLISKRVPDRGDESFQSSEAARPACLTSVATSVTSDGDSSCPA